MKVLGIFSFVLGLGLLVLACIGINETMGRSFLRTSDVLAILGLLVSGISNILFVARTFFRKEISNAVELNADILDIPEHVLEKQRTTRISVFIVVCGYLTLISSALLFLFSIYGFYRNMHRLQYLDRSDLIWPFILAGAIFLCSGISVIYSVRKLFFSRS